MKKLGIEIHHSFEGGSLCLGPSKSSIIFISYQEMVYMFLVVAQKPISEY